MAKIMLSGYEIPSNENAFKSLIAIDLHKIEICLEEIARTGFNLRVINPNYLLPEMSDERLPLDDLNGEKVYYTKIKCILEYTKKNLSLPKTMLPENAPEYLCRLVEE